LGRERTRRGISDVKVAEQNLVSERDAVPGALSGSPGG